MPRKFAAVVAGAFVVACAAPGQCAPKESLTCVSTAEAQGMDSAVLSRGLRELSAENRHLQSLLIARNGCLVAEAYWPLTMLTRWLSRASPITQRPSLTRSIGRIDTVTSA